MVACQAAEKGQMKKKYHFELKIQIEQGSFLHKKLLQSKLTIVVIGPMAHIGKIFIKNYFSFSKLSLSSKFLLNSM
jgi:hypothetical protein